MSTYAIGDIQGCYEPFMRLIDSLQFSSSSDHLICVGDLVNRGTDSLSVMRALKAMGSSATILLGNHDLHFIAVARGFQAVRHNDTFDDLLAAPDCDELVDWLLQAKIAFYEQAFKTLCVHAGLLPVWSIEQALLYAKEVEVILQSKQCDDFLKVMYGNEPSVWDESLSGFDRIRFFVNVFTRMRFCEPNGALNLVAKGKPEEHANLIPWFDCPLQIASEEKVVFGHWATLNGQTKRDNLYAIDTGCSWGYYLTALRLDDFQRFTVSSGESA